MKIHVIVDDSLEETEVFIKTPKLDQEILAIERELRRSQRTLPLYKDNTEYFLHVHEILFFETDAREVIAHTKDDMYYTDLRLYELEERLPSSFLRISKSAIVNVKKIFALPRCVSSCLVQFQDTYKHVYASRSYYKTLKARMDEEKGDLE